MKSKLLGAVLTAGTVAYVLAVGAVPSRATTYNYLSNPSVFGNYMTATVDLNCVGPCAAGNYIEGSGLFSFTLTAFNSSNVPVFSLGTGSPGYSNQTYVNYLTLSSSGAVTNWFLWAANLSITLFTIGNNISPPSNCPACVPTLDAVFFQTELNVFATDAGTWSSAAATPLPAALPLFATGLGALGLFGWRRKRKQAA